ncbi:hypothetical protein, partial [Burkholderia plantarii]|uniref:hypothetical protein n=1 Tax=Burkholderia plantarii TaxID=41899 RepID=UPI001C0DC16A
EKRDYDQRFAARQLLFSRCDQPASLIIYLRQHQHAANIRRCVRPAWLPLPRRVSVSAKEA